MATTTNTPSEARGWPDPRSRERGNQPRHRATRPSRSRAPRAPACGAQATSSRLLGLRRAAAGEVMVAEAAAREVENREGNAERPPTHPIPPGSDRRVTVAARLPAARRQDAVA